MHYEWLPVDKFDSEEQLMNLLQKVVTDSLDNKGHKSIMIFAETKSKVDKICEMLKTAKIPNLPYYSDIPVPQKATAI